MRTLHRPPEPVPRPAAAARLRVSRRRVLAALVPAAVLLRRVRADGFDPAHGRLAAVLGRHVRRGGVDYGALRRDPGDLDAYLDAVAAVPESEFDAWPRGERLALLLNLYNAATLRLILDHPGVAGIRDIGLLPGAAWRIRCVRFGGRTISLDDLEHRMIRPGYAEPRIHFALVCAARGCPPLRSEPYTGAALDGQLSDQTRRFLADPAKNRFDAGTGTLWLSPIFDWYRDDFVTGGGTLESWVGPWLPGPAAAALAAARGVRVRFTDYDWALNAAVPDGTPSGAPGPSAGGSP